VYPSWGIEEGELENGSPEKDRSSTRPSIEGGGMVQSYMVGAYVPGLRACLEGRRSESESKAASCPRKLYN